MGSILRSFALHLCISEKGNADSWYVKGVKELVIPVILFVGMRTIFDMFDITQLSIYELYDAVFVTFTRCILGLFLFCLLYWLFKNVNQNSRIVKFFSDISYEVYLTHQFILLAVYEYIPGCHSGSLLGGLLMLVISLILTVLNSLVVKWISVCCLRVIPKV